MRFDLSNLKIITATSFILLIVFVVSAQSKSVASSVGKNVRVYYLGNEVKLLEAFHGISKSHVLVVGSNKDSYPEVWSGLELSKYYNREKLEFSIALDWFEATTDHQLALDLYVAGKLSDLQLISRVRWFDRYVGDFKVYRPVLHFAKENNIKSVSYTHLTLPTNREV